MNINYMNSYLPQESIAIMFVALGLAIIGIGYARLRTADGLRLHRWMMSSAIILTMISTFFVMFPSLWLYYAEGYSATSGFSILQIIHSAVGGPVTVLSFMFLLNDLPKPTQKWMQITAALWFVSLALGAAVYYAMPF